MIKAKRFLTKTLAITLALLFVISGMTFPAFAETASTEDGLGDRLVALNIALHGQISLLFYFKDLDNVSYFKVVVPQRNGISETKVVNKSALKYDEAKDRYLLEVSVAAAQQTDTISVQAFDANDNGGKIRSYSVRDYANKIFELAESDVEKYYYICEALMAMLNYGAMAQNYFGYNTDNLANQGLFAEGTNPVNGMTSANMVTVPDWMSTLDLQGAVGFASAQAYLDGNISLRIYPNYNGDFVTSSNLSNFSVKVGYTDENGNRVLFEDELYKDETADKYYAAINGIPANKFDHLYLVEITDKSTGTVTKGSYSVLNYVQALYDVDSNLASAMYLYYLWTSAYVAGSTEGLVDPNCQHLRTHTELKGVPGRACSDCGQFFAGFRVISEDESCSSAHNIEAYWGSRQIIHYNVSAYDSTSLSGIVFNNTNKSITLSNLWNEEEPDTSFNRFSLSYYASEPVKITVNYTGGANPSTDYYLEAGEQTFYAVFPEFLSGTMASAIDSITVESCKDDVATTFVLFDYTLETATVPSSTVSIEGGIHNLSVDLSNGGAITFLSRDDLGETLSFVKDVAATGFAQYDWQTNANTRLIDVQIVSTAVAHPIITDGTYTSIYVKYLIGDTEAYFECTYSVITNGSGMNFVQADTKQIDFSGVDGEFVTYSLPTLHTVTFMSDLYAYDGSDSWTGGATTLYETSSTAATHHFRNSTGESWCAWNGAGAAIGIFVPNVDSFEAKLVGNTGDLNATSTTDYGQVSMWKTMKTYAYEAVKYSYIIATGGDVNGVRLNFQAAQSLVNNEDLNNDCVPTRIPDENPDMTDLHFAHEQMCLLLRDASNAVVRYDTSSAAAIVDATGSDPSVSLDFTLYDHLATYATYSADDYVQLRIKYMVPTDSAATSCKVYLCSGGTETLIDTVTLSASGIYSTAVITLYDNETKSWNAGWTGNIDALKFVFDGATDGDLVYLRGVQLLTEEKRVTGAEFLTEVDATDLLTLTNASQSFDKTEGATKLVPLDIETFFTVYYKENGLTLDASKYNTVKFTCMIPTSNVLDAYHCDLYLTVVDESGTETTTSIRCSSLMSDGKYHTVLIPLPDLTGTIVSARLDFLDYAPDTDFSQDAFYLYSFILSANTIEDELTSVDFTKKGAAGTLYSAGNNYDVWEGNFNYAYQLYDFVPLSGSSQAGIEFDESAGALKLTATGTESSSFDPYVAFRYDHAGISADKYSGVRFKYKVSEDCSPNQRIQIFIDTKGMDGQGLGGYAAEASTLNFINVDGEYHYLEVDLSSLATDGYWAGDIDGVRLDFFFTFYSGESNSMYITAVELIPKS